MTTAELRQLVDGIRFIERMRANPLDKDASARETAPLRQLFTRSLVARAPLAGRHRARRASTWPIKKPGTGLPPDRLDDVIGRRLARAVAADQLLAADDIEGLRPRYVTANERSASSSPRVRATRASAPRSQAIQQHPDLELQLVVAASALLDRYGNAIQAIERDGFPIAARVYMVLEGENLVTSAKSTGLGLVGAGDGVRQPASPTPW